jgi:signal transduction histidine kinase
MRAAGLAIELDFEPSCGHPATLVEWSAYRILQEALTNVAKHAPSSRVNVAIHSDADTLYVSVLNTNGARGERGRVMGNGSTGTGRDGRGLIGMRERVAVLGGEIYAGPTIDGFTVRVRLPLQGSRAGAP